VAISIVLVVIVVVVVVVGCDMWEGALCIWWGDGFVGEITLDDPQIPVNGTGVDYVGSVFGECLAGK
jgi:hypothetical protein